MSYSLWELTYGTDLHVAGAEFFVKVAVECIHCSLDAHACFAYQQINTFYVHYHFNTLHSFEDIFPHVADGFV